MKRDRRIELRVGLFVLGALTIGGSLAFVIGNRSNLWDPKISYHAVFEDVGGLRPGSPILIGGVNVGSVSSVRIDDSGDVRVGLSVIASAQDLVRTDSVASIGNKGLLGDRLVAITVGRGEPLPVGSEVPTQRLAGMSEYMQQAGGILDDVGGVAKNVRRATDPFGNEEFGETIVATARNLEVLTRAAAEGDGTVAKLLEDDDLAERLARTIENLETFSQELAVMGRSARLIVDEVRTGDGSAHELVYGSEGARLVTNLADATGELALAMAAIRTGDGGAHQLIYEDDGKELVVNLTESSAHLEAILNEIRAGRGTLGGFLTDPSIYEDVKRLVGNMERNDILRSLVRYSIRRDESLEPAPPVRGSE